MRMSHGRLLLVLILICLGIAGGIGMVLLKGAPQIGVAAVSGPPDEATASLDLIFEDSEGNSVSLADFRGKAVLLNVWATWCAPCREEMPALDRLQAQLGGPDFDVVPLSIDRTGLDAVRPFFAEIGVENLNIYLDRGSGVMRTLGVLGLPTTLLIDSNGRELQRWVGPKVWDSREMVETIRGYIRLVEAKKPDQR